MKQWKLPLVASPLCRSARRSSLHSHPYQLSTAGVVLHKSTAFILKFHSFEAVGKAHLYKWNHKGVAFTVERTDKDQACRKHLLGFVSTVQERRQTFMSWTQIEESFLQNVYFQKR